MLDNRRLFNLASSGYDFITSQGIWRDHVREMATLLSVPSPRRIIDLGCGPGISAFVLAELFPEAEVIGIDISESMIARSNRHHSRHFSHLSNLHFLHTDIYDLPFAPRSFDLATGHSFLYLLPDQQAALYAIEKVLTASGQLILLEPNAHGSLRSAAWRAPYRRFPNAPLASARFALSMVLWRIVSGRRGRMTAATLRELFTAAGFRNIHIATTLNGLGLHVSGKLFPSAKPLDQSCSCA